jgi:hypothetical protein
MEMKAAQGAAFLLQTPGNKAFEKNTSLYAKLAKDQVISRLLIVFMPESAYTFMPEFFTFILHKLFNKKSVLPVPNCAFTPAAINLPVTVIRYKR